MNARGMELSERGTGSSLMPGPRRIRLMIGNGSGVGGSNGCRGIGMGLWSDAD